MYQICIISFWSCKPPMAHTQYADLVTFSFNFLTIYLWSKGFHQLLVSDTSNFPINSQVTGAFSFRFTDGIGQTDGWTECIAQRSLLELNYFWSYSIGASTVLSACKNRFQTDTFEVISFTICECWVWSVKQNWEYIWYLRFRSVLSSVDDFVTL